MCSASCILSGFRYPQFQANPCSQNEEFVSSKTEDLQQTWGLEASIFLEFSGVPFTLRKMRIQQSDLENKNNPDPLSMTWICWRNPKKKTTYYSQYPIDSPSSGFPPFRETKNIRKSANQGWRTSHPTISGCSWLVNFQFPWCHYKKNSSGRFSDSSCRASLKILDRMSWAWILKTARLETLQFAAATSKVSSFAVENLPQRNVNVCVKRPQVRIHITLNHVGFQL